MDQLHRRGNACRKPPEGRMTNTPPAAQRQMIGSLIFGLSAICLLTNLVGLGRLAYDVVIAPPATNLLIKVLILDLLFALGLGLGTLSRGRFGSPAFGPFARVYTWVYLAFTWVTYLLITLRVNSQEYSLLQYLTLVFLLGVELLVVAALRLAVPDRTIGYFAVPMLAIVLFHLVLIVYRYVIASAPISAYLVGDIFLMLVMSIVSTSMLGENAFRALIERFIERVG
jgi:hypothetical protein